MINKDMLLYNHHMPNIKNYHHKHRLHHNHNHGGGKMNQFFSLSLLSVRPIVKDNDDDWKWLSLSSWMQRKFFWLMIIIVFVHFLLKKISNIKWIYQSFFGKVKIKILIKIFIIIRQDIFSSVSEKSRPNLPTHLLLIVNKQIANGKEKSIINN